MDKLLVTFEVPSVALQFDALVPEFMSVEELRPLLYPLLEELTNGAYVPSQQEVLCRKEDAVLLPLGVGLRETGVKMWDCLILF